MFSRLLVCWSFLAGVSGTLFGSLARGEDAPNVIVVFIDDMGYSDIGPFGATSYPTPHLDQMAREGRKFTDFIVASAVCSASRSALMTGCIHERIGFRGALGPNSNMGISDQETTIAEICKKKGYATACFGKWHLGHHPRFLPVRHGFDRYLGLPYSNDMWPNHPDYVNLPPEAEARKRNYPPLPLIENDRVVDREVTAEDQKELTRLYTERSVQFIRENKDRPFFLYLPHAMVHVPLFTSNAFDGKSGAGKFGDTVMEVDWSVGQILSTLKDLAIDERTLVIFTSDNGPWLSYGNHAGGAGKLREGKGTAWEGGVRVPTLMRWPKRIPAGSTCDQLASTIDLLPTIAACIGGEQPDLPIDGKDIRDLLFDKPGALSPHTSYPYYYANQELRAVRNDRWKLVFKHESRSLKGRKGGQDGMPVPYETEAVAEGLYDLDRDVGESTDVSKENPEILAFLQKEAEHWRTELGDGLTKRKGKSNRTSGALKDGDERLKW